MVAGGKQICKLTYKSYLMSETVADKVGLISSLIIKSAKQSIFVGSRLRITSADPLCFAIIGKVAAG